MFAHHHHHHYSYVQTQMLTSVVKWWWCFVFLFVLFYVFRVIYNKCTLYFLNTLPTHKSLSLLTSPPDSIHVVPILSSAPLYISNFRIRAFLCLQHQACTSSSLCSFPSLFKDFIYLFLDRREGREKGRERNISVWLPLTYLPLGTQQQPKHVP